MYDEEYGEEPREDKRAGFIRRGITDFVALLVATINKEQIPPIDDQPPWNDAL